MDAPLIPSLAVVLVSHESRAELLAALGSIMADGWGAGIEVVVVDAGSGDGTLGAVRSAYPEVRVLALANTGFARAANAGIRATTARVVVVANADVRFAPGALRTMRSALLHDPRLAAVGPQVRYPDGTYQASARREASLGTLAGHAALSRVVPGNRWTARYHAADHDPAQRRPAAWLSGCAVAWRREALEEVGGFDPGFFLYVEDLDLARRLRAAGWRLQYEPQALVLHEVGASTSRHPVRARYHHAVSWYRHLRPRFSGALVMLRPVLVVALTGWVVVTVVLDRYQAGRSSTGERRR